MATPTATVVKAQLALAATALTTAHKDSVLGGVAFEFRNPHHPIRQLERLFNFDPATGVYTSDDAYVDSVYAGFAPNKSIREIHSITNDPA